MDFDPGAWLAWFDGTRAPAALRASAVVLVGLIGARLASRAVHRAVRRRVSVQQAMLARRIIYYGVLVLVLATALRELGFDLAVLLGAAGVATVAMGFAAQTSVSNLISGLFLIGERAFQVGDVIRVGALTGEVLSVDLLSVKLRTFDNLFVRVPNETLIKSEVTNLSRFPVRRLDVLLGVGYEADMAAVERVLRGVAERNALCLEEPQPLFIFTGFGESSLDLQFSVWGARENYLELGNSIRREIKAALDEAGINIPYPQRTLVMSAATAAALGPLPSQMGIEEGGADGAD